MINHLEKTNICSVPDIPYQKTGGVDRKPLVKCLTTYHVDHQVLSDDIRPSTHNQKCEKRKTNKDDRVTILAINPY